MEDKNQFSKGHVNDYRSAAEVNFGIASNPLLYPYDKPPPPPQPRSNVNASLYTPQFQSPPQIWAPPTALQPDITMLPPPPATGHYQYQRFLNQESLSRMPGHVQRSSHRFTDFSELGGRHSLTRPTAPLRGASNRFPKQYQFQGQIVHPQSPQLVAPFSLIPTKSTSNIDENQLWVNSWLKSKRLMKVPPKQKTTDAVRTQEIEIRAKTLIQELSDQKEDLMRAVSSNADWWEEKVQCILNNKVCNI